jgi:hypothetical protein
MTSNSQEIIQDIRLEFEMMLDFVTGEQARTTTADQIERGLFKLLLSLGAKLLTLFFVMRSQACSRQPIQRADGQELSYHRDTKRDYFSIFGKIALWRPYFYKKGLGGQSPLDAELSLGQDCYSDLVREVSEYLGVYSVYHKTSDILERLLGLPLSTRVVEENVAKDAVEVEAYYAQKPPPAPADEAEILVIQADGKGVPMVLEEPAKAKVRLSKGQKRGRKKEAIVTTVYTIASVRRTPEAVVEGLFHPHKQATEAKLAVPSPPKPQNKHIWATLEGKDTALTRLSQQVQARQGDHIQEQIALTDGDPALQTRVETHFPDFSLILDFIHPNEYLWQVANSLFGETDEQRSEWVEAQTLRMLSSQTEQIIADFRTLAEQPDRTKPQQEKLIKTANYLERNLPYMDYQTYLTKGWPVASGVIEGACRHFVKDRCELSGMRWRQAGAENLLRLRAVAENGDWELYHHFRKRQRHTRLYGSSFPDQHLLERQALDRQAFADTQPTPATNLTATVHQPTNLNGQKNYRNLPFAV